MERLRWTALRSCSTIYIFINGIIWSFEHICIIFSDYFIFINPSILFDRIFKQIQFKVCGVLNQIPLCFHYALLYCPCSLCRMVHYTFYQNPFALYIMVYIIIKINHFIHHFYRTKWRRSSNDRSRNVIQASIISRRIVSTSFCHKLLRRAASIVRNRYMWIASRWASAKRTRNANTIRTLISASRQRCVAAYCC